MAYRLESVEYHRNGVGGEGFHVVKFHDDNNGPMVGIVFPYRSRGSWGQRDNPRVAVFQRERCGEDVWGFCVNSWRGDHYADFLRLCVRFHDFSSDLMWRTRTPLATTPNQLYRMARVAARVARRLAS